MSIAAAFETVQPSSSHCRSAAGRRAGVAALEIRGNIDVMAVESTARRR